MEQIIIKDYYETLTGAQKKVFTKDVMTTCDITYTSFLTKKRKDCFSKLENEAITKLIKSNCYEKS